MAPADLAGLIVDSLDHALAPNAIVCARPSVDSVGRLGKINTPAGMGIHDEQTISGVEAGGTVIGKTTLVGRNKPSIGGRLFGGIWNRTALFIDSKGPIHRAVRNGQEILPVGAVKNKEVAVARSLHEHLLRLAVEVSIDQHRSLNRIPVVGIVRRYLEGPPQLARVRI